MSKYYKKGVKIDVSSKKVQNWQGTPEIKSNQEIEFNQVKSINT